MAREALSYRCPEFLRQSMEAIGGDRAWVMCILVGAANTMLLAAGKLSGGEYITGLGIIFSVYTGAKAFVVNKNPEASL
jgi:hypothetical protein